MAVVSYYIHTQNVREVIHWELYCRQCIIPADIHGSHTRVALPGPRAEFEAL